MDDDFCPVGILFYLRWKNDGSNNMELDQMTYSVPYNCSWKSDKILREIYRISEKKDFIKWLTFGDDGSKLYKFKEFVYNRGYGVI